ncbi:hypothetical protein [Microbacterium sp.]|uniref:hypothetical protein n=1 Tax=Microbacterium sp. TaxID=51671 RepID=UPI003C785348
MNDIREVVDLPSIDSKPLLHPLDVPSARGAYLASWWLQRAATLPVAFLLGVVLLVATGSPIASIAGPISKLTIAMIASRLASRRAWEYIPRKRQDRSPQSAPVLQMLAAFIDALALVTGLLILIAWLSTHEVAEHVVAYAIGAGAGVAFLQLGEVVVAVARKPRDRIVIASRILALAAVATAVVVAFTTLLAGELTADSAIVALIAAAVMIAVQIVWWLIRAIPTRRRVDDES